MSKYFEMMHRKFIVVARDNIEDPDDGRYSFEYNDAVYCVFADDGYEYECEELTDNLIYYAVMAYTKHIISATLDAVTDIRCRQYSDCIDIVEALKDEYMQQRKNESIIRQAIYNAFYEANHAQITRDA